MTSVRIVHDVVASDAAVRVGDDVAAAVVAVVVVVVVVVAAVESNSCWTLYDEDSNPSEPFYLKSYQWL